MAMTEGMPEESTGDELPPEQPQGGYCIQICVMPSGEIMVGKSNQMPEEPGEAFPDIKAALSEVLELYRQNPVSGDEQAEFESGYGKQMPKNPAERY